MAIETSTDTRRTTFPATRNFTGFARPSRVECDIFDLEIEGSLPVELDGAFYRAGPDPHLPPRADDDVFVNGDGMITLFRIADGHVDLRMRYVQTDKLKAERAARRALFGAY